MAQVIELQPSKDTAHIQRAKKLFDAGNLDEAYAAIDEYMMREPNDAQALTLAASILKRAKKVPVAYSLARRATELRPDRSETWNTLGHCAQHLWRLDEAESGYRKALQRAQDSKHKALYLNNIASVHIDAGRFSRAEKFCRESLELDSEDRQTRHNLGLCLLSQRQWAEGWQYYSASIGTEARRNVRYRGAQNVEPVWDGSPDKTVVIYGEQGLGDEICAASMLPDALQDCKKVILDCDHRLEGLFKRSFPQAAVYGTRWAKPGQAKWKERPEEIDASIAGFEIGQFYRKTDSDFPGEPYLVPDPDRVAMWKALFASKGKPVIGIAWSGGTWHNAALHRHLPLSEWRPIFDAVNAHWVSLQYKDASKEIEGTPVTQYKFGTLTQDYDDTAAMVVACDLVVGIQTSVFHLAGALGVPAWVMIPRVSQWRYGEEGESIPWYKSLKIYRQTEQWPVKRIANDLKSHF
jgi:tetratricopeptide (TPR) repeat protein